MSYIDYVREQLKRLDGLAAKRMFGGHGLYRHGVMFGLIADDQLYFKVGAENLAAYKAANSHPFVYQKGQKQVTMSYWLVPEEIVEDAEELVRWARAADRQAVSLRKHKTNKAQRKKRV